MERLRCRLTLVAVHSVLDSQTIAFLGDPGRRFLTEGAEFVNDELRAPVCHRPNASHSPPIQLSQLPQHGFLEHGIADEESVGLGSKFLE